MGRSTRSEEVLHGWRDPATARDAYARCLRKGLVGPGDAEQVRWWTCRSLALSDGRSPEVFMLWLLAHPDTYLPQRHEDAGAAARKASSHPPPAADEGG